jgi:Zn-dependent peptidase ImmA (M78 family)
MSIYLNKQISLAKNAAKKLLEGESHKAPVDVVKIASKLNIDIVQLAFSNDGVSGLLKLKSKSGSPVIAVNKNHHENRQRFTIAHEIGHYLLHNVKEMHVDSTAVYFRDEESTQATNMKEIQANQFAAELLMPKYMIINDLKKISFDDDKNIKSTIKNLAKNYKVSEQAMLIRIGGLLA